MQASQAKEGCLLSSGEWIKLSIKKTGVYKLGYDELAAVFSDPSSPRVFGNGGKMLPLMNAEPRDSGLVENHIWIEKGGDGIFNSGDYILFYCEGPVSWSYSSTDSMFLHSLHLYDEASYYFVSSGNAPPEIIDNAVAPASSPDRLIDSYDHYMMHEKETQNLIRSGRQWFEPLPPSMNTNISFPAGSIVAGSAGKIKTRVAARAGSSSGFEIRINNQLISSIEVSPVVMSAYTSDYARTGTETAVFYPGGGNLDLEIQPTNINPGGSAFWLDRIDINLRKELIYEGEQLLFRDINSVGPALAGEFHLKHNQNDLLIWDITNKSEIKNIDYQDESYGCSFKAELDSLREYIAFKRSEAFSPEIIDNRLANQNLRSVINRQLLIVSAPEFREQAELIAAFHQQEDNLSVYVTEPADIYNEFSSGARDPAAIRDFVRHVYLNSDAENRVKYLLLFGDGSYDNKSDHRNNTNRIPTYQSWNSLNPINSYVTDDFYGLLDTNEGEASGLIDIGIGRIPSNTVNEAEIVTGKILAYYDTATYGDWRSKLCFVGDDEDNNIHMRDANSLTEYIDTANPSFHIQKIFLDAYKQVSSPSGEAYPDVNKAINEAIKSGILIFNYTGHGNERGLAHEDILGINDIQTWNNRNKLPLFITATCEFSRFDDIAKDNSGEITRKTSAGEHVILTENGGGIGLLTTTRLVYSSPNFILNKNFYSYAFKKDSNGIQLALGDVLRLTKNKSGPSLNKRNFTLLGDPALKLAYPGEFIFTDSINAVAESAFNDTIKGLNLYKFSGHIEDINGDTLKDFNGYVNPSVYDKKSTVKTLSNNGTPVMEFEVMDKILYKGKARVESGMFDFSFRVPKDISFQAGPGRLIYYARDMNNKRDAGGFTDSIIIGGISDNIESDTTGPEIELYLNDDKFKNGGITDNSPLLFANISDISGINTIGIGIGHDIIAIMDDDISNPYILNSYFESDLDTYMSGSISFPFFNLEKGKHKLSLKVWDVYNNSSRAELNFEVDNDERVFRNILNYPNPFAWETNFSIEHNLPDTELKITIYIYNISGRIIKTIVNRSYTTGYRIAPIHWNGMNDGGNYIESGFYIYRAVIEGPDGIIDELSGKMVKAR